MRIQDALKLSYKGLWRNKGRTVLTIIAVSIAAFTITLTLAVGAGVNGYLDRQVAAIGADNVVNVLVSTEDDGSGPTEYDASGVKQGDTTYQGMKQEDFDEIRDISGVKSVHPFEHSQPAYIEGSGGKYLLSTQALMNGQQLDVVDGAIPSDSSDAEIAITTEYQDALGCATASECVGSKVQIGVQKPDGVIQTLSATVTAVVNDSIIGAGRLWTNDTLQDEITKIAIPEPMQNTYMGAVVYADSSDPEAIKHIKDKLSTLGFTGQTIEDEIGVVAELLTLASLVLAGFGLIALLAASFGVVNTLYMSVQDRTREIGIMKAHGLSSKRIFGLFSTEAILIGLWGSVFGIGIAWIAGIFVNSYASDTVLKEFPGFTILEYPAWVVIGVAGAILVITFLSGTLPARRAARLDPIEALRYE